MDQDCSILIERQFTVSRKEKGMYHAFPTVIRVGDDLWLAYRSGKANNRAVHGLEGKVMLIRSSIADPSMWEDAVELFAEGNELDAVISGPFNEIVFLGTRTQSPGYAGKCFLSRWQASDIFPQKEDKKMGRQHLHNISDTRITCFGHIRRTEQNTLLLPGYGRVHSEESVHSPLLLFSEDEGKSWSLRSIVASSEKTGTTLSEFSLAYLENDTWVALIRNEMPPYPLMLARSTDDGRTWSDIEPTALAGHAPMLLELESGRILVVYRDLSKDIPGISMGMGTDFGRQWHYLARFSNYEGSIYDGGYSDIVSLGNNRFLAVYYICDADASPWIEGTVFYLDTNRTASQQEKT